MRILILGSDKSWSIERFYLKYLNEIKNVNVELFPVQNVFNDYYRKSVVNKLVYRLGFSSILKSVNKSIFDKVDDFKPDIVWVFKGMEVFPETLKTLKDEYQINIVNYNPDNPFIFTGRGSGNSNVSRSIGLYDAHFTYNFEVAKLLKEKTHAYVEYLPFGYELSDELFSTIAGRSNIEILKVCFVGNPDKERVRFLSELASRGISLDIYGDNWSKAIDHKNITVFKAARDIEFWQVLRRYRIQLNLMRVHNLNSHNMRTFEIPAIGGIQLAPETNEHKLFFNVDKEIFLFSDVDSCVEKINMLLSLSKCEADAVRSCAFESVRRNRYSYEELTRRVYSFFSNLLKKK